MKSLRLIFFIIVVISTVTACAPKHESPEFKKQCFPSFWQNTPCGACVVDQCKGVCDNCSFNEPTCRACWNCLDAKGCGFDGKQAYYIDKEHYVNKYKKTGKHRFVGNHRKKVYSQ